MQVRMARPTAQLDAGVTFHRDRLGHDGIMFAWTT
jgi:hypothetical protein